MVIGLSGALLATGVLTAAYAAFLLLPRRTATGAHRSGRRLEAVSATA
jgi:hypothetical protein